MAKHLLIVESPAKAKTIEKFLGKDFKVMSSYGHIRDLDKGNAAIDIENDFSEKYIIPEDKKKVVKELKKLAKEVEDVWLATDEDREGEAISWHLCEVLGLDPKTTKRIVFHEITESAIKRAVDQPRTVDQNLVNAQRARRILDRLVGFELSPILWRKLAQARSAGRVQSVAVRLIVEREREIQDFEPVESYKISAFFDLRADGNSFKLKSQLAKGLATEEEARQFLEDCKDSTFTIDKIEVRPSKKSPSAPFTTSTLQQEASRKLGFSVAQTMLVAQKLYEAGKITYMRTDSVNLSNEALGNINNVINNEYGSEYAQTRTFKNKSGSAQEAHEAIRPTYVENKTVDGPANEQRLYDLIWKRTVASQMADARLENTNVKISISKREERLVAKGQVIKFDGFLKLYLEGSDEDGEEDESGLLPPIKEGQELDLDYSVANQRFTRHPSRYTEASLVKKLEELGIGRPSTYAPTISTVQKRGYVVKEDREGYVRDVKEILLIKGKIEEKVHQEITGSERSKLFPTDLGKVTTDFLQKHFDEVMDYSFTADLEEKFDKIAEGDFTWNAIVGDFYKPFHETVEETMETAERETGERDLGVDPKSGRPVIARMGRYGPMVQMGKQDDEEKPKFAKLRPTQSIETITFEEAMDLFKMPRVLGEYEDKEVKVSIGRYGPYILHDNKFTSIPKEYDVYSIPLEDAIPLIDAKRKADAEKFIKEFEEEGIQVLNGRWGPYVKKKGDRRNYTIPKELKENAKSLTLEQCQDIIKNAPPPGRRRKKT